MDVWYHLVYFLSQVISPHWVNSCPFRTAAIMPHSTTAAQAAVQSSSKRNGEDHRRRSPAVFLADVRAITERLFPHGPVDVELDCDPSVPSEEFYLVSVTATGSASEIVDRECEWDREICHLDPNLPITFRLSVREIV